MGFFESKTDRALRNAMKSSNARYTSKMVRCPKCGIRQSVVGNANNADETVTCRNCGHRFYMN